MLKKPRLRGFAWKLFGCFQSLLAFLIGMSWLLCVLWGSSFVLDSLSDGYRGIIGFIVMVVFVFIPWHILAGTTPFYPVNQAYLKGKKIIATARPLPSLQKLQQPIVYLRSFQDDITAASPLLVRDDEGRIHPRLITEEEQLAAVMKEIGPFVAIGRPGEELPELGADRMYVQHEKWQEEVITLISIAQLVVIRIGVTEGVLWELRTALRLVKPERLVLLVPEEKQYEAFCRTYAVLFPAGLPPYQSSAVDAMSIDGIISFEPDWMPQFRCLQESSRYSGNNPLKAAVKIALIPVFERLGLPYHPLTVPWDSQRVIRLCLLVLMSPIIVLAIIMMLVLLSFFLLILFLEIGSSSTLLFPRWW
jgi:hypothetical protein